MAARLGAGGPRKAPNRDSRHRRHRPRIPGVDFVKRARPDLRDRALKRGLPRIGHRRRPRLGHGASEIRQRQRAVETRLGETIDDRVPVSETLPVGVAITLHHGRGLHDLERCRGLLGQAAADHVQPSFDPDTLLGVAHRR